MSETASIAQSPSSGGAPPASKSTGVCVKKLGGLIAFAAFAWLLPVPEGLDVRAWKLFIIFFSTIVGIILKLMPMGAMAFLAILACSLTGVLSLKESLVSFSLPVTWLIVFAFVIARGFILTGLGSRIAYFFISLLGKNTLGLSYGFVLTETLLAMFIPSNTARGAGIVFPIVQSLSTEYNSNPNDESRKDIGAYLMKVCFQTNTMTSAMFLTAIVCNPLVASLAGDVGLSISWGQWALMTLVPGALCLIMIPLVLYILYAPKIKNTPEAPSVAKDKLKTMGKLSFDEIVMLGVFGTLLVLWMGGKQFGIDATTTALLGVIVLLVTGVLSWNDILEEKGAWGTMVWFAVLLGMAGYLAKFGMMAWVSHKMEGVVHGMHWGPALIVLLLTYFYIHYFFASVTAHVTALYGVFLAVAITTGAPPMMAAMLLGALSGVSGCLTHYGTGSAPVYFGSGYVTLKEWWTLGAILSVIYLSIWGVIGTAWWKMLGIW